MPTDDRTAPMRAAAEQKGLWRLMLKLPSMRGQLQILAAKPNALAALCEAYEDASSTRDNLQRQGADADPALRKEYEDLCVDIETDVIDYCLRHPLNVPR